MILSNVMIFSIFCLQVHLKTKKCHTFYVILTGLNLKKQLNIKIGQKTEQLFTVN